MSPIDFTITPEMRRERDDRLLAESVSHMRGTATRVWPKVEFPESVIVSAGALYLSDARGAYDLLERYVEAIGSAQRLADAFKAARRRRSATATPIRAARPRWQRSGRLPARVVNAMDNPRVRGQL